MVSASSPRPGSEDREVLTLAQAAEVLGVPVGTVKSRLFRARRMLRERLDPKDGR